MAARTPPIVEIRERFLVASWLVYLTASAGPCPTRGKRSRTGFAFAGIGIRAVFMIMAKYV
jgi:hypothetical protein